MIPMISAQLLMEYEQGTKTILALLPMLIENFEANAKVKRGKFDALVKEGFTEEQAMEIIVAGKSDVSL